MDLNELTPELFEKAEFAERRRGYDIDQVERFLEETGTAVAQLLVKHRQLEERAATAETRLAEAERRLQETPAPVAGSGPSAASAEDEAAEIERATSTLLMAKRTADATISEAESQAAKVRGDANAAAERIVGDARAEAEAELAAGRERLASTVANLEARRDALDGVVEGFEQRIATYRDQLSEVASTLLALTENPEALAARVDVHVPAEAAGYASSPSPDPISSGFPATEPAAEREEVDLTDSTQAHDTASAARGQFGRPDDPQASQTEAVRAAVIPASETPARTVDAAVRESSVVVDAEPVTGQTSDRFLRELDEAVNEAQTGDEDGEEAMSAFFEGGGEEQGRSRFGWRR